MDIFNQVFTLKTANEIWLREKPTTSEKKEIHLNARAK
jgi:hypothetical protein